MGFTFFIITQILSSGIAKGIEGVHVPIQTVHCNGENFSEYSLGEPLKEDAPLLNDLFNENAMFAPMGDKDNFQSVSIKFVSENVFTFDVKVPTFKVKNSKSLFSFVRGFDGKGFSIFLVESKDNGLTFVETAGTTLNSTNGNLTKINGDASKWDNYIDPVLVKDFSTCPPTFRMTAECSMGPKGNVDVCESHSQTPLDLKSWTKFVPLVEGNNWEHSGSTGVTLIDSIKTASGKFDVRRYTKWSDVQNKAGRVTTVAQENHSLKNLGKSGETGSTILDAVVYPCQGSWDCNNKDAQDWKREGNYFYLAYNGANYYGCENIKNNSWGISFARAFQDPLAEYVALKEPTFKALRDDLCGISYPYINVIDGEIYLYYAYYEKSKDLPAPSRTSRSKLVCKANKKCGLKK